MNLERWAFTLDRNFPPWAMDARHIDMIGAVVRLMKVRRAVEIGLLMGRSTTAFVEAKEAGAVLEWVGLCDPEPKTEARRVAEELGKLVAVEVREVESAKLTDWRAELWVIDGDHSEEVATADVMRALNGGAEVVVIHDHKHGYFTGPGKAAKELAKSLSFAIEDCQKRPNEETERGLFIAFRQQPPDELLEALGRLMQ